MLISAALAGLAAVAGAQSANAPLAGDDATPRPL